MTKYLYVCNSGDGTYTRPGLAVIHEKATGHRSFKIMEEPR